MKEKAGLISGIHCSVNEICALPVFYAAEIGSWLLMFRDNLSVPSQKNADLIEKAGFMSSSTECLAYTSISSSVL